MTEASTARRATRITLSARNADDVSNRSRRLAALAGLTALALALGGCGKSNSSVAESLRPALLAVPGVTGGTVNVTDASVSVMITCRLTSDGQTHEALKTTLDGVLRVLTSKTRDLADGTLVDCLVRNGVLLSQPSDLGLANTYLSDVRAHYT
jgi:hypothetical protein